MPAPRDATRHLLVLLGLAALIGAAFSNALRSGMVLDNQFIIQGDPRLRAATWENVRLTFTEDYWYPKGVGHLYRPLTTLSFLLNYAVLGNRDAPAGYHWINLGLHLLNAALVYALMLRLLEAPWPAALVAMLFAVHPVVVESVTNIVGRSDLLAAASVLGGLLAYIQSTHVTGWHRGAWLTLLFLTTSIGILCKESAVVIAGLLPLYDITYRCRWKPVPGWRALWRRARELFWGGYVVVVPALATMVWVRRWLFSRWALPPMAFVDNPLRGAPLVAAELTAVKVIGKYLWLMSCPLRLSADYSFNQIQVFSWDLTRWEDGKTLVALVTIVMVLALAEWAFTRRRALFFLIAFFFVTLAPASNLFVSIDTMMAERFLYLPLVGFLGCVAIGVEAIPWARWVRYGLVALAVVALGARTLARNADWESDLTLWTSARDVSPDSYRTHRSLAWAMYLDDAERERDADAILRELERALAILDPLPPLDNDKLTYLFMGIAARTKAERLGASGETTASRPLYERSVAALERAREIDQAQNERHREEEVRRGQVHGDVPDIGQPQIYENLGLALGRLGRHEDALAAYRYQVHLEPINTAAYRKIADEQSALGRHADAAITLVELLLLGETGPETGESVLRVYGLLDHGATPAVVANGDKYELNLASPLVHEHVCTAAYELARIGLESKRWARAEWARGVARDDRCNMQSFDELWRQLGRP